MEDHDLAMFVHRQDRYRTGLTLLHRRQGNPSKMSAVLLERATLRTVDLN